MATGGGDFLWRPYGGKEHALLCLTGIEMRHPFNCGEEAPSTPDMHPSTIKTLAAQKAMDEARL